MTSKDERTAVAAHTVNDTKRRAGGVRFVLRTRDRR